MNTKSLDLLEFSKVRERLAALATFSAGKGAARALEPFEGYGATVRAHLETAELLKLLDAGSNIGLGGAHDVRPAAGSCGTLRR